MTYTPNPARAERWIEALEAGTREFVKLYEKKGRIRFTRLVMQRIMTPMWSYFEYKDLNERIDVCEFLADVFEDFWRDYDAVIRFAKTQFDGVYEDGDYPADGVFERSLASALEALNLYEDVKEMQTA